ncbi:hypothetical protein VST7929_02785 [Vibrio stylophorae]|uniref:diguanylate cyclase n=1 Tax=Vibrio stylophorae TaxID=659351 RepID=A0ABM8ZWW7_9VIBR|nr:GGDEF domain-containing protein [Vibrio stylophorae]CAH0535124.1 hypothetical protein VST7929_02785 [Vibrio stylophorae]
MQSQHEKHQAILSGFFFFKVFLISLLVTSLVYHSYNIFHVKDLNRQVVSDYSQIYAIIRRFNAYYNNTSSTLTVAGQYDSDPVSVLVNETTEVKDLTPGIKELHQELKQILGNNLWTVAVLAYPAGYSHFLPLRERYKQDFTNYNQNTLMVNIIERENLSHTYQHFYGCNLKISPEYIENGSEARLRTIYLPIYNNRALNAVLAVDIQQQYIADSLNKYNKEHFTVLNNQQSANSYSTQYLLPCSDQDPITIGVNYIDVLEKSIVVSILITLLVSAVTILIKQQEASIKRDRMTNFYRRDYYESRLNKMHQFAMLLIDIDHFKMVNDNFGHKKGDEVIQGLARIIEQQIRNDDIAIRWGGEEFIVLFQSMSAHHLQDKAERIRKAVEETPIAGLHMTISIGGISTNNSAFSSAYKLADSALYESKRRGRNMVTMA